MWSLFHQQRMSRTYRIKWTTFLDVTIGKYPTVFYQHATDFLFQLLLKKVFPITTDTPGDSPTAMSREEENALRYVAGYVIRKVLEDFKGQNKSSEPSEEVLLLYSFSGDEDSDGGTEQWTDSVDRGGLWHISDQTYHLFCIAEEVCRSHLKKANLTEGAELGMFDVLHDNVDLMFHWSILSAEIEDSKGMAVLKAIIKLYISIRGHAFASSCLELYKQHQRKTLQKKKALRTELYIK